MNCLNYPNQEEEHNKIQIFIGNLRKNEMKHINLSAKIILNTQNIKLSFPLFDVKFEYILPQYKNELDVKKFSVRTSKQIYNFTRYSYV